MTLKDLDMKNLKILTGQLRAATTMKKGFPLLADILESMNEGSKIKHDAIMEHVIGVDVTLFGDKENIGMDERLRIVEKTIGIITKISYLVLSGGGMFLLYKGITFVVENW